MEIAENRRKCSGFVPELCSLFLDILKKHAGFVMFLIMEQKVAGLGGALKDFFRTCWPIFLHSPRFFDRFGRNYAYGRKYRPGSPFCPGRWAENFFEKLFLVPLLL